MRTRLLLIGAEADIDRIEKLSETWRDLPVVVARELPLPHLAAVIEKCRLFLGHDSGISHVAAAVGTPCILLFGPTDPSVWGPAQSVVRILEAPEGDLDNLLLEAVQEKVTEVL